MPARVHIVIYQKLVNFVFNLVYTQNVFILMTKLDEEQREILLDVIFLKLDCIYSCDLLIILRNVIIKKSKIISN